ncbi:MAG: type II 3-dehydroquinate dehydratase [Bdellovibrionales bacterium]|nr:type II 3-dehydroquinate dehydratase [Oligoflexia bacterium]
MAKKLSAQKGVAKKKISPKPDRYLVLHGPNLNLLGTREPEVYGGMTLADLNGRLQSYAKKEGFTILVEQSNSEGDLIDILHECRTWAKGIVFNPGAYTHYSYALRDAVASIGIPTVEVHLSDIQKREDFRRISVIAPVCLEQVSGLGFLSYIEGFKILRDRGLE